jgi:hypothetical protein
VPTLLANSVEKTLLENEVINIFEDDFQRIGEEEVALEQGAHTVLQVGADVDDSQRMAFS